ncbi:winged helix-turn-helix domain-containing tetratricopeptide repeat protein [Parvularcula marina]|uniref:winged helix-turn-helix domain-containing tetratricopeptide repeat protein n=1 Tax=Parvularcula marina TaxID=2292771 RepID=UPI0035165863
MIHSFGIFELDIDAVELRREGAAVPIEPQVFALIVLLIENRHRMVSKDEIIETIWNGRIVSESALTSRIKSARKALGDDGKAQKLIRTVHGMGFRFVGELDLPAVKAIITAEPEIAPAPVGAPSAKPSIAVLPFRQIGVMGPYAGISDAIPYELISSLSRLRWLKVIARGSSFRLRSADPDLAEIGRLLGVRYCVSGAVEVQGSNISVTVDLAETESGTALWGERYDARIEDVHTVREEISSRIVAALEIQISANEAQAARLKSPDSLDAWSAYHLGLQHLYRFTDTNNAKALGLFQRAVSLEPDFARAHAGLSSAHFQNAFLRYVPDRRQSALLARKHAELGLEHDPLDPFANFSMGRAHWVEDNVLGGIGWLEQSVSLSPNYAQGVYARAWAETIVGRARTGAEIVETALSLSPLDPFRYGMLGVKAFAHMMEGEYTEGARLADASASSPGAHALIAAIAVAAHEMNGDREKAGHWLRSALARKPDLSCTEFFQAFPFDDARLRADITRALVANGIPEKPAL